MHSLQSYLLVHTVCLTIGICTSHFCITHLHLSMDNSIYSWKPVYWWHSLVYQKVTWLNTIDNSCPPWFPEVWASNSLQTCWVLKLDLLAQLLQAIYLFFVTNSFKTIFTLTLEALKTKLRTETIRIDDVKQRFFGKIIVVQKQL